MIRVISNGLTKFHRQHSWSWITCRQYHLELWPSKKIRKTFIDFFQKHDHQFVPSSSVIPKKDEGSYFINAGMNQFKPLILGTVELESEMASYRRVVNSQKCIRVGGKHNDLDDVGHDSYHHTFFEMLGNWSFGDYFKKEACLMAWNLLTEVYGLPKSQLYVTYFGGCKELGLEPDLECRDIWHTLGVPADRILPFDMKDNFWVMGNTGPCGPCTEIHFDHLGRSDASHLVNSGSPEVIELWNLVFMQYDRQVDGSLRRLPRMHVDTGMGLERLTAVLQGRTSNYDTDLFTALFDAIQKSCQCPPYSGRIVSGNEGRLDTAYRIVADHTRMLTVTIADGLLPGRKESGAKLRHIMHRCIHQATQVLGSSPGFVGDLSSVVVDTLGDFFPELVKNRDQVRDVTNQTEIQYLECLAAGKQVIAKALAKYGNIKTLTAQHLIEIQEGRFGKSVPADVIALLAGDFGLTTDMEKFEEFVQQQQVSSGTSVVSPGYSYLKLDLFDLEHLKMKRISTTDDILKYDRVWTSDGYGFKPVTAKVVALKCDGQFVDRVDQGGSCGIILDKTNFYSEAGGQIADQGTAKTDKGDEAVIHDAQLSQKYVLHTASVEHGSLSVGDTVQLEINESRRQGCMSNHTASHILNFYLNKILGNVRQQSSMVNDVRLTFDFTCSKTSVSNEDLALVSESANRLIQDGSTVFHSVLPLNVAKNIEHLVMLTDEVYPSSVNVISVGVPVSELLGNNGAPGERQNSVELCCGTHVDDVNHLGAIVITHLQGSNQGIKRLVAVTGRQAAEALENARSLKLQVERLKKLKTASEALHLIQNIEKSLSSGCLLPKSDREQVQKELEHAIHLLQVNRSKNEGKLTSLTKEVEDLLHREHAVSSVVSTFNFSKTREIVEVLVRLAPKHPVVLISTCEERTEAIVGVVYVPREGSNSFVSSQWADFLCQSLQGTHSVPKGKLAKHTNIRVFSIPSKGNRKEETQHLLDLAQTFIREVDYQSKTNTAPEISESIKSK